MGSSRARPGLIFVAVCLLSVAVGCGGGTASTIEKSATPSTDAVSAPSTAPPTEPSPAPTTTLPCTVERLAEDLGSKIGTDVAPIGGCEDGWVLVDTYASCTAECGDSEALARLAGTRWDFVTGFPSALCRDEARAFGVPDRVLDRYGECAPPTSPPPVPEGGMCPTPIYLEGAATPTAMNIRIDEGPVTCAQAAGVWREYEAYPEEEKGGNTLAAVLPSGWTCAIPTAVNAQIEGYDAECASDEQGTFTLHAAS